MSNLSKGPIVVQRAKSLFETDKDGVGAVSPDHVVVASYAAALAATGAFIFVAPRACRVVGLRYVADVNGAASSKLFLRHHVAGQSAAANAAAAGSTILELVTGGIATDSAVRVPTSPTVVGSAATLAAGAKLALVPSAAAWVGCVTVLLVWK